MRTLQARRSLLEGHARRDRRDRPVFGDRHVLGVRTEGALVVTEHVVAGSERIDASANRLDGARELRPEDLDLRLDESGEEPDDERLARPVPAIGAVHRRRPHVHEHLAVTRLRCRHIDDTHHLRRPVPGAHGGLHRSPRYWRARGHRPSARSCARRPRTAVWNDSGHRACRRRDRHDVPLPPGSFALQNREGDEHGLIRLPGSRAGRGSCINLGVRWWRASGKGVPRLSAELRQRESVRPLELFFDLVFVVGFTQCTALMSAELSWHVLAARVGRAGGAVVGMDGVRLAHQRRGDRQRARSGSPCTVNWRPSGSSSSAWPEAFDDQACASARVRRGARRTTVASIFTACSTTSSESPIVEVTLQWGCTRGCR